ncbi:hypothetical protein PR048_012670 [Dryococelus australis]|uniref:Uncharacterized protein n=1 Tax=Dryococelus australis TaxID=614101 RepID=A0ABQ9HQ29_9NEOP|nr:hypothetical protein PR048_012670 [Dryococelus australis]
MINTVIFRKHRLGPDTCSTDLTSQKKFRVYGCQMSASYKEPSIPHEVPRVPYIKVGADLECSGCTYLIFIDYYSHWLNLCPLPNKSSKSVISTMQNVFNVHDFPKT